MSVSLFLTLVSFLAVAVSFLTEAIKKLLDEKGAKYSSNVVVLIISIVVGIGGTAVAYMFLSIPFNPPNVICMVLMAVAVWVGAMIGYDKIVQLIGQVKNIKK